jgi:hypothetical protein
MIAFGVFVGAIALGAPYMITGAIGIGAMALGLGAFGLALKFIATRDLEAIATFTESLAVLEVSKIDQVAEALERVAQAMDDIPTAKAIALTATMTAASTAAQAAQILANQAPTTNNNRNSFNERSNSKTPININMTVELDGEALNSRIRNVNVDDDQQFTVSSLMSWAVP